MAERPLAGCRILIVEDEYMLAEDLYNEMDEAGAIVLGPVPDVEEALVILANNADIHGAILDINLGGEESYAVADELLRRGLPFLFTTGYDAGAIPEKYRHVARCQKPIPANVVRFKIGLLIQK